MCQMFVCGLSCDGCLGEIFCAHAEHRAHKRGQRFEKLRLVWRTNCERRGEKYFARAKNDVGQKSSGCYAPPMADVRAKNISPVPQMMRGRNDQGVRRHQWPMSGRKIFRPDKLMIGYAKIFANILMIDSAHGGDRVTEYQART